MLRARVIAIALALAAASLVGAGRPWSALAAEPEPTLVAYLDGKSIPLADVGKYYCDDFAYPVIHCSSIALAIEARATVIALLTGVDYVTVYDKSNYQGAYMNVAEDYGMLATIGWNDKISSFRGRNSETGRLFTDWLFNGSAWNFCCNTTTPSLGSYDNTFSSMQRT